MRIIKSDKFSKWYRTLDITQKNQVDVRITRILIHHNFGHYKKIGDIFELKFKSGLRVYYAFDGETLLLLLNGGDKNTKFGQSKDIRQARAILRGYINGE